MHEALPDSICNQVDNLRSEALKARRNGGVSKLELLYHLLPGDDRRLSERCTIQQAADEFGVVRKTVEDELQDLHSIGVLNRTNQSYRFSIADSYRSNSSELKEADAVRADGGSPIERPSSTAFYTLSQRASGSQKTDLLDYSKAMPMLPIAVLLASSVAALVGSASSVVMVVSVCLVFLMGSLAKMLTESPLTMVDKLISDSNIAMQ